MKMIKDLGLVSNGERNRHKAIYECRRCLDEVILSVSDFKRKKTDTCNSCTTIERNMSHGECGTRMYNIWKDIKKRCNNKKHKSYSYYGGDGATVCDEWSKFEPFKEWADANGYSDKLTIERNLRLSKEYSPNNCSWVTRKTQARTTRRIMSTNTSGYRGVSMDRANGKFKAYVIESDSGKKKQHNLGSFNTALEAAIARDTYVVENEYEHTLNGVL